LALSGLPRSLKDAAAEGILMANDVAKAISIERAPKKIGSIEDAYAVASSGARSRFAEVREHVMSVIDPSKCEVKRAKGRWFAGNPALDPVDTRCTLAYAAAALLAIGELESGVRLANK